ncbi:arsenate reductase/protein-tyrosine-phosphatase family protein [Auraticoccus monumenti]|uniref:Protein-tyrosine phosphatase n=1 Tax=Auraticoccus monumenti TaxID=675864 RepID=A0A1G6RF99_9ACTN|nr:hypothetical protein [Auraticoccus monumenti]SDD03330.1 protein-tyrosine phosphatase [Auraticoccus monumenti]
MTKTFSLLAVCTGNVCRSPVAERLLAERLGPTVEVSSAGTRALVGEPIHGPMAPLLEQHGGSPLAFSARQVREEDVRTAQLVLAMSRQHRAAVVELWPGAVRRTFTLLEFARIVSGLGATSLTGDTSGVRLSQLLPLAAASRSAYPAHRPGDDDVVDPYGRAGDVYRQSMEQILPAVEAIVAAVR